mgnify:CR=1 FL=1
MGFSTVALPFAAALHAGAGGSGPPVPAPVSTGPVLELPPPAPLDAPPWQEAIDEAAQRPRSEAARPVARREDQDSGSRLFMVEMLREFGARDRASPIATKEALPLGTNRAKHPFIQPGNGAM